MYFWIWVWRDYNYIHIIGVEEASRLALSFGSQVNSVCVCVILCVWACVSVTQEKDRKGKDTLFISYHFWLNTHALVTTTLPSSSLPLSLLTSHRISVHKMSNFSRQIRRLRPRLPNPPFSRPFTTSEGHRPVIVHKRSFDILHDPWFNKVLLSHHINISMPVLLIITLSSSLFMNNASSFAYFCSYCCYI